MTIDRRHFLWLLTGTIGTVALNQTLVSGRTQVKVTAPDPAKLLNLSFTPISSPIPLAYENLSPQTQQSRYARYDVQDDLLLPPEFEYEVLISWGDRLADSRCGYNNDYLGFVATARDRAYLGINFEYISTQTWLSTYPEVMGKSLPIAAIRAALPPTGELNAHALPDASPLKQHIQELCREALIDQGFGVIALQRDDRDRWQRSSQADRAERRITGISGLEDGKYLQLTGGAVAIFQKTSGLGYLDGLGDRAIGTFANCAGGTTPWGTFLSAEENFHSQVPEAVALDGTASDPSALPFVLTDTEFAGQGNVFGLAGNKYGWIVEIDPANPQDFGKKHTNLGRYRHEAVGVRVEAGKPLAFYSGCDRRGGHLYKFVSRDRVRNPSDKANSQLLETGTLYAAKFNPDGTGQWLPLVPTAPINPDRPSQVIGGVVILHDRDGYHKITEDQTVAQFAQTFKTLGDVYQGNPHEQQGAILIDAHFAANAIGATYTARPEDTEIAPDGSLYIAFTSGSPGSDGGPDKQVFVSPIGETAHESGWVMRLTETDDRPEALTFTWEMAVTGGEPSQGGAGLSNPDNLLIDRQGNLWIVTDMSTDKHNQAVPQRQDDQGQTLPSSKMVGIFGNNSLWYIPTQGEAAGIPVLFSTGPIECETTGPCFDDQETTLFLAVQHPGEATGTRRDRASETRQFRLTTTDGTEFVQTRTVPLGSNWPTKTVNAPPKPSVVAIYRQAGGAIIPPRA